MATAESAADYDARYLSETLDEVPLTGPGTFDADEKRKAAATAESKLEADVNDGHPIETVERSHAAAANAYASYLLYLGPTDPSDTKRGDTADTGEEAFGFADRLLDIYDSMVESITTAKGDEGSDEGIGGYSPDTEFRSF
jgi:hypothetical protein